MMVMTHQGLALSFMHGRDNTGEAGWGPGGKEPCLPG